MCTTIDDNGRVCVEVTREDGTHELIAEKGPIMTDEEYAELETHAQELGAEMGVGRASWVFDGNTAIEMYREFLRAWEDGDPVLDGYDPQFSVGEFAGESASELGIEGVEDVFLDAFSDAYWAELERVARHHTAAD